MDEREAVARLQRGDLSGLEPLVRQYQARAVRAAYLITRNAPLAEDIVQGAFVRAYQRIAQLDAGRPFGPWFLRTVANDALKAVARRQREVSLEHEAIEDVLASPDPEPAKLLELAETRDEMWEALARLSPPLRATVVLHYYLGLTETEASRELACPRGTIRSRLHAARQRLRELLHAAMPGSVEGEVGSRSGESRCMPHVRGGE